MGSFNYDKKKEHELLAEKALKSKDYAVAFFHTAQAAQHTFSLAEQCTGKLTQAYLANAKDLLEIATKLKQMAQEAKPESTSAGKKLSAPSSEEGKGELGRMMELPKEKLSDVAGMEAAKTDVRLSVIEPINNPEKAKKYGLKKGGGLLLYGLPGTGKTFFAKAVAGELGLPFYVIKSDDVYSKYVGESGKNISKIFEDARSHPMSVIFIDETNGILTARDDANAGQAAQQVVNIILQELNGADSDMKNPFLLIGATNYPDKLDEAGLDRFQTIIEVELPVATTREFILKRELSTMTIGMDDGVLAWLTAKTDGYSCREAVKLANMMRKAAARDEIDRLTVDFCEKNYQDVHVNHVGVAQDIERFKRRLGLGKK